MKTGDAIQIGDDWWVAGSVTRTRIVLKLAESELHAKRLKMRLTQCEMAKRLQISQAHYCKLEKGVASASGEMLAKVMALFTGLPSEVQLKQAKLEEFRARMIKGGAGKLHNCATCGQPGWVLGEMAAETKFMCLDCLEREQGGVKK